MMRTNRCTAPGFALIELAALIVVACVLGAMLLIMGDSSRRAARLGDDQANLRRIGTLTRSYASDFADQMWAYNWRPGNYTTHHPDLQVSVNNLDAAAKQAVAIMRDRSTLTNLTVITGWLPHISYSHLVLQDYADLELPDPLFISSGDRHRLRWAADPQCLRNGCFSPQPSVHSGVYRWAFSASFMLPPAFYEQAPAGGRISQGSQLGFTLVPGNNNLAGHQTSSIAYPSNKVMMYDMHSWHFGSRRPTFILPEARIPLLMADGAVAVRTSADSNLGAHPNLPASATPYTVVYAPQPWEPPAVTGPTQDIGDTRYRWTRMGIEGRDFGGPAVWP